MTEKKPLLVVLFIFLVVSLLASLGGLYYFYSKYRALGTVNQVVEEEEYRDLVHDLLAQIDEVEPTLESSGEEDETPAEIREFDVNGILMKDFIELFKEKYGDDMDNIPDFYYFDNSYLDGTAKYTLSPGITGPDGKEVTYANLLVTVVVDGYEISFTQGVEGLGGRCEKEDNPCCDSIVESSGISFWNDGRGYQGYPKDGSGMIVGMENSVFDAICGNKEIVNGIFSKLRKL